jgi:excisionase family DNA binding protein
MEGDDPSITVGDVTMTRATWWDEHPDEYAEALEYAGEDEPEIARRRAVEEGDQPPARRLTLTVEEAAATLGISRASAYEAARRGDIPSIRIGKRILVPRSQLDRLLNPEQSPTDESDVN